jgi:iron complex transport system substrate-binding protein
MRIASLAPSVTEILYELGADSEIVCSTVYCDFPEAAKTLPKIGSWLNVDIKKLKELKPDIVFTSSAVQGNLTKHLRSMGFNVVNVNPTRLNEVADSYVQIGQLVNREREANTINRDLYKKIMAYTVSSSNTGMRVYSEEWSDPPMSAGNWVPDIIQLSGGVAGIVKPGELSREFSQQEILSFNPQVIVLHICGFGTKVEPEKIMQRASWEPIEAIQQGAVHVIDDSLLNRPTSRLLLGLQKMKEILHSTVIPEATK